MAPKLQTKQCLIVLALLLVVLLLSNSGYTGLPAILSASEIVPTQQFPDTVKPLPAVNQAISQPDSLRIKADTLAARDSLSPTDKFMLKANIDYASADSLIMDIAQKQAYMYGNASIEYEDIKLKASVIVIDFDKNTLYAKATYDSLGNVISTPEFTQGSLNFKSKELAYNFTSKKGLIHNVVTREGEGFVHGTVIKKINDSVTNVGAGEYTTCDLDESPHFSLKYTKAKIISGNKIVTGPAYMNIEGVPLPFALPFGLFPNKKGRSSGLIIPKYGEMANMGFYLEGGGYYFGLNDYFDLRLLGDIYSRGSWALKPQLSYRKRYKFSGDFRLQYSVIKKGTKGANDYSLKKDFLVNWSHRQDPKARPNSVFSASVNAGTSSYNKINPSTINDYVTNTMSSSISYSLRLGEWGNLTTSANHNQNTSQKTIAISLPSVDFSINPIYPFKRKNPVGKAAWYESVKIGYNMRLSNQLNTYDSLIFTQESLTRMTNGMLQTIPINGSVKILKYLSLGFGSNYNERWYTRTIRKTGSTQQIPEKVILILIL